MHSVRQISDIRLGRSMNKGLFRRKTTEKPLEPVRALSRILLGAYDFAIFYCGLLLFGCLSLGWSWLAVPLRLMLPHRQGGRVGRFGIAIIFRLFFGVLELSGRFRFDLSELDALRDEKSILLAPNHPSLWDAIMIASRLPDVSCVMKAPILNNPCLGGGARLAHYISSVPLRPMINHAVDELERGGQLLLFPEGTRTTRHPVNPLTGSISIIASRSSAPVQTIIIETNSPFLGKGWLVYRKPKMPIVYRIRLGRRFVGHGSNAALMAELEQYYAAELSKPGTPANTAPYLPGAVGAE